MTDYVRNTTILNEVEIRITKQTDVGMLENGEEGGRTASEMERAIKDAGRYRSNGKAAPTSGLLLPLN
jgi:hypothetical protein